MEFYHDKGYNYPIGSRLSALWELIKSPPETNGQSRHYGTVGFEDGLQLCPHYAESMKNFQYGQFSAIYSEIKCITNQIPYNQSNII